MKQVNISVINKIIESLIVLNKLMFK